MITRAILFAGAAVVLLPTASFAQWRNQNLEPTCSASGSGMDPRCVGDTSPGTLSDLTTERQEQAIRMGRYRSGYYRY